VIERYPYWKDFGDYQVMCSPEGEVCLFSGPCSLLLRRKAIDSLAFAKTSWRAQAATEKLYVALGDDQSCYGMQLGVRRDEVDDLLASLKTAFATSDRILAEARHA